MQIKNTVRYYCTPIRKATITPNIGEYTERLSYTFIASDNVKVI